MNIDERSFRLNFEVTAIVADETFAREVERMLVADFERARLMTLEELEMPYEVHPINLSSGAQKEEWFLKMNPNGRIPVIVDRDLLLVEGKSLEAISRGSVSATLVERHVPLEGVDDPVSPGPLVVGSVVLVAVAVRVADLV